MKTLILIFVLLVSTFLYSTIINVPAEQPTIQDGINAAADADTVLVQPGTYVENINYNGKLITVASLFLTTQDTSFISSTIIDGNSSGSVVIFESGEGPSTLLTGFTITNGSNVYYGGGISCSDSNPSLENVIISDNYGAGIYCAIANPSLLDVTITGNYIPVGGGGGIHCIDSNPSLVNVTITDNWAYWSGGGIYFHTSNPSLMNVTISGNTSWYNGGGIHCIDSNPSLENVTISGNSAPNSGCGGGIYCSGSNPNLVNCVLWNDFPDEISGTATVTYSDIQGGWEGEGNIDEDPLFVGIGEYPFMLQDLSPCVNAGIPDTTGLNLPEFDLAGNPRVYGGRIDMGAYENQNVVVNTDENLIPLITKLNQNYPNPFNPTTTINYSLRENSKVTLNIYNIKGQKVKQLVSDQLPAGQHSVVWNGKDENKKPVSSGIYFYKLKTGDFEKTRKMILMK